MLQEAMNELQRLYRLRDEGKEVQVQIVRAEDELRNLCLLEVMNSGKKGVTLHTYAERNDD